MDIAFTLLATILALISKSSAEEIPREEMMEQSAREISIAPPNGNLVEISAWSPEQPGVKLDRSHRTFQLAIYFSTKDQIYYTDHLRELDTYRCIVGSAPLLLGQSAAAIKHDLAHGAHGHGVIQETAKPPIIDLKNFLASIEVEHNFAIIQNCWQSNSCRSSLKLNPAAPL